MKEKEVQKRTALEERRRKEKMKKDAENTVVA